ncbi:uncharacterized protein PITG_08475 [Phytophthora infestans T30-4]|uniref:Uncharacterized protein n=1 Tax=Phytophthora infestans (strain T30-4) TaxID=403677 RepID=D0NAP9_PHYIT|nr:uncharacterized protein PITG_08475 [Phytophthora infestans T30-4]EEY54907.1 conserved hypothetical protein [Phytophthora infestans T30-4]|eukprot:XP_002903852.1 conserved hypothetical protein [Phytophthora infestans T30-4]
MVFHDQVDWRSLEDSLALDVRLIESLDEKRFAKVDVLVALEKTAGYLEKRPWLRVLHTRLACVSFEKEGASLHDFVRSRQRDRTVSLRDVRRRLEAIYADAKLSTEVEERHKNFVAQARAVSPWCVRNPKWLHSSPARQLYGVHILPPRRVTEEELQAQRECVASHARAVVSAAVGVVMDKMLAPYLTRPKTTERRTGRPERDDQLRALRLELLAPTADLVNTEAEATKKKSKDEIARVMMQLATVEAQGDARLARKVLDHSIVQSGLRRAAEQANRLGITRQPWEVLKLWRELYRDSTLQALDTALHA